MTNQTPEQMMDAIIAQLEALHEAGADPAAIEAIYAEALKMLQSYKATDQLSAAYYRNMLQTNERMTLLVAQARKIEANATKHVVEKLARNIAGATRILPDDAQRIVRMLTGQTNAKLSPSEAIQVQEALLALVDVAALDDHEPAAPEPIISDTPRCPACGVEGEILADYHSDERHTTLYHCDDCDHQYAHTIERSSVPAPK